MAEKIIDDFFTSTSTESLPDQKAGIGDAEGLAI
jgi:hypothetical protein